MVLTSLNVKVSVLQHAVIPAAMIKLVIVMNAKQVIMVRSVTKIAGPASKRTVHQGRAH
jgi:hypothetical protein